MECIYWALHHGIMSMQEKEELRQQARGQLRELRGRVQGLAAEVAGCDLGETEEPQQELEQEGDEGEEQVEQRKQQQLGQNPQAAKLQQTKGKQATAHQGGEEHVQQQLVEAEHAAPQQVRVPSGRQALQQLQLQDSASSHGSCLSSRLRSKSCVLPCSGHSLHSHSAVVLCSAA